MTDSRHSTRPTPVPGARRSVEQTVIHTAGLVDGGAIGRRRRAAQSAGSEDYRAKRRDVIQAAATVFAVKGYHATNLDDIAVALDTHRASLYYYVSGKEELLHEAVAQYAPGLIEQARSIATARRPTPEKLRSFVSWIMAADEAEHPHRYLFLLRNDGPREDSRCAGEIDEVGREIQGQLVGILNQGIDSGELRTGLLVDLIAHGVYAMLNWTDRSGTPTHSYAATQVADCFTELLLDGITTPHGRARRN